MKLHIRYFLLPCNHHLDMLKDISYLLKNYQYNIQYIRSSQTSILCKDFNIAYRIWSQNPQNNLKDNLSHTNLKDRKINLVHRCHIWYYLYKFCRKIRRVDTLYQLARQDRIFPGMKLHKYLL